MLPPSTIRFSLRHYFSPPTHPLTRRACLQYPSLCIYIFSVASIFTSHAYPMSVFCLHPLALISYFYTLKRDRFQAFMPTLFRRLRFSFPHYFNPPLSLPFCFLYLLFLLNVWRRRIPRVHPFWGFLPWIKPHFLHSNLLSFSFSSYCTFSHDIFTALTLSVVQ